MLAGAAQVKVTYPQLAWLVTYVQNRHPVLKQVAATGRGSLDMSKPLPLQPKAYLALISFLRECRKQQPDQSDSPSQAYLGKQLHHGPDMLAPLQHIGYCRMTPCLSKNKMVQRMM